MALRRTGPVRTRLVAATLAALGIVTLAACGGDDASSTEAAYCAAWQDLGDALRQVSDLDIVAGGTDAIREYVDGVSAAADQLRTAAGDQLGSELDTFRESVGALAETVTSPSLPVDRVEQVRAARDDVESAWEDLVAAVKADCPTPTDG